MKTLYINGNLVEEGEADIIEHEGDTVTGKDKHGNKVFTMQGVKAKVTIKDGRKNVQPDVPVDSEKTTNSLNKKIARLETKLGDLAEELESLLAKEA